MKKYLSILIITLLVACSGDTPKQAKKPKVEVPIFNSDSAYHYIQTQVDFGPRYISSKGWEACGDYLFNELKSILLLYKNKTHHIPPMMGKIIS